MPAKDDAIAPFMAVPVLQFREDTFDAPRRSVVLATSPANGLIQAFRYGENAYGMQFHSELTVQQLIDGADR